MVAGGQGCWGLDENGEGIKKHKWVVLQNSHRDVDCRVGNLDNNVATLHGARWVLEIKGGTLCKVCDRLATVLYT